MPFPNHFNQFFSEKCAASLQRLAEHKSNPVHEELQTRPLEKQAAVLILLFEQNKDGILRVLLTTRSKNLRSHPGQTALPGGKVDSEDLDVCQTALREAFEEIALPNRSEHVHVLGTLEPFLSLYRLTVTPVVAVLTDASLLDSLKPNEAEVERIFHHPLEAVLDPPFMQTWEKQLTSKGGPDWPYETDWHNTSDATWLQGSSYRMHRFRTTETPIKGLTSDILIHAAQIAFAQQPTYERYAPDQLGFSDAIEIALKESKLNASSSPIARPKESREVLEDPSLVS